jgi:hypothetical protein
MYTGQYLAVSETYLTNTKYYAALRGLPNYDYLLVRKPIDVVGGSIYVYKLY